jgi:hypothetical protein
MPKNDQQINDILAGIGAGFQSYDPNNMFRGAGAAISANVASRQQREMRDKATADEQSEFDRRFAMNQAEKQQETEQARQYRKEDIAQGRQYQAEDARTELDLAIEKLKKTLDAQRENARLYRQELKVERGAFHPMDMSKLLDQAFGAQAPRYSGLPYSQRSSQ